MSLLRYFLCVFLLVGAVSVSNAQKRAWNWYFGNGTGLSFSGGGPSAVSGGSLISEEGCASISDLSGNLLFYTNGENIWNKDHQVMSNGSQIGGNASSTQSCIIVPRPGNKNIYYVFTTDQLGAVNGLRYTEVDMTLNGGKGEVTSNKGVQLITQVAEKLTAVRSDDGQGTWVITHGVGDNKFYAFQVTANGVITTPVSSMAGSAHGQSETVGTLKASPDGKYLASVVRSGRYFELLSFSASTGQVSGSGVIRVNYQSPDMPYGAEFSADISKLYISCGTRLYQYNMSFVFNDVLFKQSEQRIITIGASYGLQLGPDGKIYMAKNNLALDVINHPKNEANSVGYLSNAVSLGFGKRSNFGLPNFISNYLIERKILANDSCSGDSTSFVYLLEVPDSVHWDFSDPMSGNSNYSSLIRPKHKFTSAGTYNIKLHVINNSDVDTFYYTITIHNPPAFNLGGDTTICSGSSVLLNPNVFQAQYLWQDGKTLPVQLVSQTGVYWVKATKNSCSAYDTIRITVDRPQVSIQANGGKQICSNQQPLNLSFQQADSVKSLTWNFGNSTMGNMRDPQVRYASPGDYLVQLETINKNSCRARDTMTVRILPLLKPSFSLNDSVQCFASNSFEVSNLLSADPRLKQHFFDFGDGFNTALHDVKYSYTKTGTYRLSMISISQDGCMDTLTTSLLVQENPKPSVGLKMVGHCEDSNQVILENLSVSSGSGWKKVLWEDGTGKTVNGNQTTFSYEKAGSYQVTLSLEDKNGCVASVSHPVKVHPLPEVNFSVNIQGNCIGTEPVRFSNNSTISDGTLASYLWDFGDGSFSSLASPVKTYSSAGLVEVGLEVTSSAGCKAFLKKSFSTYENPVARFEIRNFEPCFKGNKADFINTSTNDGAALSYRWDLDGDIRNNENLLAYRFPGHGSFPVKLTVSSAHGCKDQYDTVVTILPSPQVAFKVNDPVQCSGQNLFIATSQSRDNAVGIKEETWTFNDRIVQANQVNFSLPTAGKYPLTLRVINDVGCMDEATLILQVQSAPIADFKTEPTCLNQPMVFQNTSYSDSGVQLTHVWNFGDNHSSSQEHPAHFFDKSGKFQVYLEVTTDGGCKSILVKDVEVLTLPEADFTSTRTGAFGQEIAYSFEAYPFSPVNTYRWLINQDEKGSGGSLKHNFSDTGLYKVTLEVIGDNACKVNVEKDLHVIPVFDIYIPSAFSPNGDGLNDRFGPGPMPSVKEFEMIVFNRWGAVMFHGKDARYMWDGTFYGEQVPVDSYGYYVRVVDMEGKEWEFKGSLMLTR